jgi:hypothetical protein
LCVGRPDHASPILGRVLGPTRFLDDAPDVLFKNPSELGALKIASARARSGSVVASRSALPQRMIGASRLERGCTPGSSKAFGDNQGASFAQQACTLSSELF